MRASSWARTWAGGTALAACLAAGAADAATWVRYSFSGTGTANYFNALSASGTPARQGVTFSGVAYVDLDAGAAGYKDAIPATVGATAGSSGLGFSLAQPVLSGLENKWSASAALAGVSGFSLLPATQPTSSTVSFDIRGKLASYTLGTGTISAVTAERVAGPGSWDFSVATNAAAASSSSSLSAGPVPEPETWVTLLAGFALLGLGLRYRRRTRRASLG